jgi:hypothetical protein
MISVRDWWPAVKRFLFEVPPALCVVDDTVSMKPRVEYTLADLRSPNYYSGIIDLRDLSPGDELVVSQFFYFGDQPLLYAQESFSGRQELSALVLASKEVPLGIKVTAKLIHGPSRILRYQFFEL